MLTGSSLRMRKTLAVVSAALTLVALSSSLLAQRGPTPHTAAEAKPKPAVKPEPKSQAEAPPPAQAQAPAAAPARPQVVMPDAEKIVLLVRTTLLTLNDALRTGNYTVLRDKGAPSFRDANSAARLGEIFSSLAASGLDLSVVSVVTPQLSEAPVLDQAQGTLNLKGYFPTKPTQIDFEVLYQSVGGHWQVFGLSVQPVKAPQAPQIGSADGKPL
jgi:hypothetical protein